MGIDGLMVVLGVVLLVLILASIATKYRKPYVLVSKVIIWTAIAALSLSDGSNPSALLLASGAVLAALLNIAVLACRK